MLNQLVENIDTKLTQRWVALGFVALVLCASCSREDDTVINGKNSRLSIQKIEVSRSIDWASRSASQDTNGTSYVKLCDSLRLYAQVETWEPDTSDIVTRGTPIVNVTDLSNIRMNLYNSASATWTTSTPTTEVLQISRSGKIYITAPSYNWSSKTDKVTLLTYTPLPSTTNGLTEGANGNTVAYTVPTDVTRQPDFCSTIADVDIVNNDGIKHLRSLTLYHQFTAIGFSLNGWNAKVSKIEVSGVAFSGTYALRTNVWTLGAVAANSRLVGVSSNKVPADYYNDNTVWTDITRSNGYLMMIPQTLTDKSKVQITYTDAAGKEQVMTAMLNEMSSGKWQAGYKITYCIQLKTAPSIGTEAISLYMPWKAGYTTTAPLSFVVKDPQDRYTFNWAESWNVIHRGPAKVNNISGGAGSGWYTSTTANTPIWFFTIQSNPSTSSSRSSVVTLDAWRTVDRTFNVVQGMKPYITVEGMPSTSNAISTAGGTYTVTIKSNYPWETTVSNMKVTPSSGAASTTGQRVEVTIPASKDNEGKINTIFKTTNDDKVADLIASASYTYTRETKLDINPKASGEQTPYQGKSYKIQVTASESTQWTANCSKNTVASPSSGTGSTIVTVTVGENEDMFNELYLRVYFLIGNNAIAIWGSWQDPAPKHQYSKHDGWAGSNIYWDPTVTNKDGTSGRLTFDGVGVKTHEQYSGVFFSWGSLIPVSPGGSWTREHILYAPGTKDDQGRPWSPETSNITDWHRVIPTINKKISSSDCLPSNHALLDYHNPDRNIGDICKWMTDKGWAPSSPNGWRMPTLQEAETHGLETVPSYWPNFRPYKVINEPEKYGRTPVPYGYTSIAPMPGVYFPYSGRRSDLEYTYKYTGMFSQYWIATPNARESWASVMTFAYNITIRDSRHCRDQSPVRCVRRMAGEKE